MEKEELQKLKVPDKLQELEAPVEASNGENVKEFLDHFFGLVDKKELAKFFINKMVNDPEAKAVMHYLRGDKFKAIVSHIMNDPEYTKVRHLELHS